MSGAVKKDRWILKIGAGGWAALGIFLLLCLLLYESKRESADVKTEMEIRLEQVLEKVSGAGETYAMINEENGNVTGVLIVCEGAENIAVRLRVQDAARAILNVENANIHVMPMKGEES